MAVKTNSLDLQDNELLNVGACEFSATTGTAPMSVASTTKVDNLNADLVDGKGVDDTTTSTDNLWTADKISSYVTTFFNGRDPKENVRVVVQSNVTIASDLEAGDTLDGVELEAGDRVLLVGQSTASLNGIYVVQASGAAVRSADLASTAHAAGAVVPVTEGSVGAGTAWICVSAADADVVGTDALTFSSLGSGESNTMTNLGAGEGIYASKSGVQFRLKSLVAGSHVTLSSDGNEITITVDPSGIDLADLDGVLDLATQVENGLPFANGGFSLKLETITGNGSTTEFTVNHGFNLLDKCDFIGQVFNAADEAELVTMKGIDGNNMKVIFSTAPADAAAYRVRLIKLSDNGA